MCLAGDAKPPTPQALPSPPLTWGGPGRAPAGLPGATPRPRLATAARPPERKWRRGREGAAGRGLRRAPAAGPGSGRAEPAPGGAVPLEPSSERPEPGERARGSPLCAAEPPAAREREAEHRAAGGQRPPLPSLRPEAARGTQTRAPPSTPKDQVVEKH